MKKTMSREEQLFLAASELEDANDRELFLRQACGDDVSMYERVSDLLAIDAGQNNILDETSEGLFQTPRREDTITAGTVIGPYKLLQEIGSGGMGVVFMARQSKPVRRKVAIKIIRVGMDTKNFIARFEAERQALAIMNHPGITGMYDAGVTACGRPYFVMELINGLSVTKYCDKQKVSPRARVEIFRDICNAVQHAHQKGVIHRDIKPSNVLVTHYDGVPVPKIIDFGIAKAMDRQLTEKTLFTSYGNMIGTPEYMSPEQAEMSGLDTDVCSDVYSLGVLLFELLTGTTPFYEHSKSGLRKICDAICTQEAELASTRIHRLTDTVNEIAGNRRSDSRSLRQFLRGDLDWIIAKCLSKDRRERYQTAAELSSDIERYLGGGAVHAAAPSTMYRVKKFAARNRAALAVASVVFLSLLGTTAISTTYAWRAMDAEKIAMQEKTEADDAREQAQLDRDRAKTALQKAEEANQQAAAALRMAQQERDRAIEAEQRLAVLERESRVRAMTAERLFNSLGDNGPRFRRYPGSGQIQFGTDLPDWQVPRIAGGIAQTYLVPQTNASPDSTPPNSVSRNNEESADNELAGTINQAPQGFVPYEPQARQLQKFAPQPTQQVLIQPPANTGQIPGRAEMPFRVGTQMVAPQDSVTQSAAPQSASLQPPVESPQGVPEAMAMGAEPHVIPNLNASSFPDSSGQEIGREESGTGQQPKSAYMWEGGVVRDTVDLVVGSIQSETDVSQSESGESLDDMELVVAVPDNQLQFSENKLQIDDGSILIVEDDGTVVFEVTQSRPGGYLLNREQPDEKSYPSKLEIRDLDENNRNYVDNILNVVIESEKQVNGENSLSLAEPQFRSAQIRAISNEWYGAEQQLGECEAVLSNSSCSPQVVQEVQLLKAVALAKQGKIEAARELIAELRKHKRVLLEQLRGDESEVLQRLTVADPETIQRLFVALEQQIAELEMPYMVPADNVAPSAEVMPMETAPAPAGPDR